MRGRGKNTTAPKEEERDKEVGSHQSARGEEGAPFSSPRSPFRPMHECVTVSRRCLQAVFNRVKVNLRFRLIERWIQLSAQRRVDPPAPSYLHGYYNFPPACSRASAQTFVSDRKAQNGDCFNRK